MDLLWKRLHFTRTLVHCPLEYVAVIDVLRDLIYNRGFLCVQTTFHSSEMGTTPVPSFMTLTVLCSTVLKTLEYVQ